MLNIYSPGALEPSDILTIIELYEGSLFPDSEPQKPYWVSKKASLPLCGSSRYIAWMMPMGTEDGLRRPRHLMVVEESPLGPPGGPGG